MQRRRHLDLHHHRRYRLHRLHGLHLHRAATASASTATALLNGAALKGAAPPFARAAHSSPWKVAARAERRHARRGISQLGRRGRGISQLDVRLASPPPHRITQSRPRPLRPHPLTDHCHCRLPHRRRHGLPQLRQRPRRCPNALPPAITSSAVAPHRRPSPSPPTLPPPQPSSPPLPSTPPPTLPSTTAPPCPTFPPPPPPPPSAHPPSPPHTQYLLHSHTISPPPTRTCDDCHLQLLSEYHPLNAIVCPLACRCWQVHQ